MGMDLEPIKGLHWGRYNWSGWEYFTNKIREWGIPMDEFSDSNDGKEISEETCKKVAEVLLERSNELPEEYREWMKSKVLFWENCGGCKQF